MVPTDVTRKPSSVNTPHETVPSDVTEEKEKPEEELAKEMGEQQFSAKQSSALKPGTPVEGKTLLNTKLEGEIPPYSEPV